MSKFCAFILSHGRADAVFTTRTLRKDGYTGDIRIIIDDTDPQRDRYEDKFPGEVYVFSMEEAKDITDTGDNFTGKRGARFHDSEIQGGVIYARNMCWRIAERLGYSSFVVLDDDYTEFRYKVNHRDEYIEGIPGRSVCEIWNLDSVFAAMVRFLEQTRFKTLCMAQGGDYIGGVHGDIWKKPKRKAMNSFVCLTDRPFQFIGRVNEDVNAYTFWGARGDLFLTCMRLALQQRQTQKNSGGMTEIYLDSGTYVKSIYSVIYQPSSVRVAVMMSRYPRIHHQVRWRHTVPKIISPQHRKA
jgi:hypothetical protein